MVLSLLKALAHHIIDKAANPNKERYTCVIYNGFITPAIISLEANDTFRIGIIAVTAFSSIPGRVPITAGKIMAIFNGATILWASLKERA